MTKPAQTMADLEAVLADVSYLMAMEKSKCTPAARKESEDLNFLLQSGIILCKLASIIVPEAEIEVHHLQVCFRKEK